MQRAVRLNNDAKLVLLRSILDNTQYVRKGQWLNVLDLACGEGNDLLVEIDRSPPQDVPRRGPRHLRRGRGPTTPRSSIVHQGVPPIGKGPLLGALSCRATSYHGTVYLDCRSCRTRRATERDREQGGTVPKRFDLVTIFHASTTQTWATGSTRCSRLSSLCGPGGVLLIMYMDEDAVRSADGFDAKTGVLKNDVLEYSIRDLPDAKQWEVRMGGIGQKIKEPYMTLDTLRKAAVSHGFSLKKQGNNVELMADRFVADELSADVRGLVGLYKYAIFQNDAKVHLEPDHRQASCAVVVGRARVCVPEGSAEARSSIHRRGRIQRHPRRGQGRPHRHPRRHSRGR